MTTNDYIEFEATNGHTYTLHVQQVRAFEGNAAETRILATVGGSPIIFRVARPYKDVAAAWRKALDRARDEAA